MYNALNLFTVAFFGHRNLDEPFVVEELLKKQILNLISEKEYVDFLVGRNGEFDQRVASAVKSVQKNHRNDNSTLILMLAYESAEFSKNKEYFSEYYGEITLSQKAARFHPKAAIEARNCEMVDKADLIICYVKHENGGAYKAMKYAIKTNKPIINLATLNNL